MTSCRATKKILLGGFICTTIYKRTIDVFDHSYREKNGLSQNFAVNTNVPFIPKFLSSQTFSNSKSFTMGLE